MKEDISNIDDLITSFVEGELTSGERSTLQQWIEEDTSHRDYFRQVYKIWVSTNLLNEKSHEIETALKRIKLQIHSDSSQTKRKLKLSKRTLLHVGKWAAVVLVSLCTGAFLYFSISKLNSNIAKTAIYTNEVTVPLGSKSQIRLPDGTEVVLNAGSKLTYTTDYGKKLREIEFSGEAYFKVAKMKDKPFIVHTSKTSIEALGTEFNVKAYPNENIIEAILVEGSIKIHKADIHKDSKGAKDNDVILKPGQMLQIAKDPKEDKPHVNIQPSVNEVIKKLKPIESHPGMKIASIDVKVETSWKDKRWIISGTDMADLAVLLSRRFNVNIQLKDSSMLSHYKFTGVIENEPLEEVLNIVKFTVPITCKFDKGNVTWSFNHEKEKDFKDAYK
jgi:ferric-dicitrate binding protein FerR (iron transport regulator)